ncbi:MAG TPA: glycosyltransferase [Aldersonia sp.]
MAIIIAAHNEAAVIDDAIESAAVLLPRTNVFVVSDASTDETAEICRDAGVNVLDLISHIGDRRHGDRRFWTDHRRLQHDLRGPRAAARPARVLGEPGARIHPPLEGCGRIRSSGSVTGLPTKNLH